MHYLKILFLVVHLIAESSSKTGLKLKLGSSISELTQSFAVTQNCQIKILSCMQGEHAANIPLLSLIYPNEIIDISFPYKILITAYNPKERYNANEMIFEYIKLE